MSRYRLVSLAGRLGDSHPIYELTRLAVRLAPDLETTLVRVATDWAVYAASRGRDPFSLTTDEFIIITQFSTIRPLRGLCPTADPPEERQRVIADAIRDLRDPVRRITAARDLLAIGLLGAGVERLDDLASLRCCDLGDTGTLRRPDRDLAVGQDVVVPASVLRALLERQIGPLRDDDALVPTVGKRLRAYCRDDRADMLSVEPLAFERQLGKRLRRAGLDIGCGVRRWSAPSWFVGVSDGSFRLPPDLAVALAPSKRS